MLKSGRPYDYDITFFDSIFGIDGVEQASFMRWGDERLSGTPALMDRVLSFSDFREQYAGYVRALYDPDEDVLDLNTVTQRLNAMRAVVQPYATGYQTLDEEPYGSSHAEILNFVLDRTTHAIQELGN